MAEYGLTPEQLQALPGRAAADLAGAFGSVFVVATLLVALCLVPAFLLPRRPSEEPVDPAAMVGH